MSKRFFEPISHDIIFNPARWRMVSSLFTPEVEYARNTKHEKWARFHIETHEHKEILFVIAGDSFTSFKHSIYPAAPGTVFFFNTQEEHENLYPSMYHGLKHLWISIYADRISIRLMHIEEEKIHRSRSYHMKNTEAGHAIYTAWNLLAANECRENDAYKKAAIMARLLDVLLFVYDHYNDMGKNTNDKQNLVDTVKHFIRERAGRGITIERLARQVNYSHYYFMRIFKQYAGITVHEYINKCRYEKTRMLLQRGFRKSEISDYLGFSCPAAFSKWLSDLEQKEKKA